MENISPDELALELLNQCLRGNAHPSDLLEALLRRAMSEDRQEATRATHALFRIVVERLADLFEPCLCDAYAALFSEVIGYVIREIDPMSLVARYRRIRQLRPFSGDPSRIERVYVLSRVTLGADVAITSVLLDAARKAFPQARILFTGPRKNAELFAGDERIALCEVPYPREGSLTARLRTYNDLKQRLEPGRSIVIDPDSRLTQLGLLPVFPEEDYYFFDSRSAGGYGDESLAQLTQRWAAKTFAVENAHGFVAPANNGPRGDITVSLGVGENPAKRIPDPFEPDLVRELSARGDVLVDRGGSEEEAARVEHAARGCGGVRLFSGSFAAFARAIAESRLYCGYDSAGMHVAAVSATPLVAVFAGYPSQRFLSRWRPYGPAPCHVIAAEGMDVSEVMERVRTALG